MNKVHVKKGDTVVVLSGKNSGRSVQKGRYEGKKGKVIAVFPKESRVIVEGVNIGTKHNKPRSQMQPGGIVKAEHSIHSSNVMLVCPKCGKPAKVGKMILESGDKARVCKKCNEIIDTIVENND